MALLSALLSSCGGGIDVASNGDGITGTGITAGRVTGFGSICVNGIKFDVDKADFIRDGDTTTPTDQSDFSIGEYIVIKGSVSVDGTGIAEQVIFEDLLEGVVTKASNYDNDANTIEILGQQIIIDGNTKLIDARTSPPAREVTSLLVCDESPNFISFRLMDLIIGNIVEVSGVKNADG